MMNNNTFFSILDKNNNANKKIRKQLKIYAFDEYLLPILPVAIKQGLHGYVDCAEQHIMIKDIIYNYFVEISPNKETADKNMKQFLEKCTKS